MTSCESGTQTWRLEEPRCEDANVYSLLESDLRETYWGKQNYYKNHFSLPEEHRDFFEELFRHIDGVEEQSCNSKLNNLLLTQ